MKLFKYKSLDNLWHVLDIIINKRLYCANWRELNDPLEGRYEIYLGEKSKMVESKITSRVENARDEYRIASLTSDPTNFLMWSHYGDGHKGVVIEVDVPEDHSDLCKVSYSPFSVIFTDKQQAKEDMHYIFNGKTVEWAYEDEYRIVTTSKFCKLSQPVQRILIGPMVDEDKRETLRKIIPHAVEMIDMELDRRQGTLIVKGQQKQIQQTKTPERFEGVLDASNNQF